jgi:hypothetical protein
MKFKLPWVAAAAASVFATTAFPAAAQETKPIKIGVNTLDADFRVVGVVFIQSIAKPIGHRIADDYHHGRRLFQFPRRRRLRVIDGWRWSIVALARERREKITVGRSPVIAIRGVAVAPAARGAIVPAPTT